MRLRAVPSTLCAIALAGTMIAGCGGSSGNGVEAKSADQIAAAARSAAESAHSVTVSGVARSSGVSLTLDLQIDEQQKAAKGTIAEEGFVVQLIRIGESLYIKGDSSLYRHFGAGEAAKLLEGKWVKLPVTGSQLASIGSLTELPSLLESALGEHNKLSKGSTSTVNGQEAIAVKSASGGTLYVALTGKPYPVQFSRTGSEGGKVTFKNWNGPVSVSAPANAVDVSKLP